MLALVYRPRRREWEAEYVSEYCQRAFPGAVAIFHCRLGTWPTPLTAADLSEEEQRMLRVRMRWADAVILPGDRIIVVEGKLRASEFLKGVGELQLYVHLLRHTPEFEAFKDLPVVGRLVIPFEDPAVALIARQQGLDVATYRPTFYNEYLGVLQHRQARPIRPEEAELV